MNCRSCGGSDLGRVIDLGPMPLVNNFLDTPDQICARWPLEVVFCRQCSLVQLTETPPPRAMFDTYLYYSSQSQTMLAHARRLTEQFVKAGQRVVEIASNDGYLLRQARDRGALVLGIDPARNIAAHANESGVPTRCEYFARNSAIEIVSEWGHADVIFANNVLAHVPDPNELAAGICILLADHGVAHIEVPYVKRMIELAAFDTIYHEHHSYFSISSLKSLFDRHALRVTDVEMIDIHGGSLHLQVAHEGDDSKAALLSNRERTLGLYDDHFHEGFAARVEALKSSVQQAIAHFDTVAGYGAAAKGVVLLNNFGLESKRLPWVADVSPHKQGKYIPGTGQRIVPPEMLIEAKPQAALLLPWNIKDEIISRSRDYLDQGGSFIVPIPEVQVIRAP